MLGNEDGQTGPQGTENKGGTVLPSGPEGNQNGKWFSYERREAGGQLLKTIQNVGSIAGKAATLGLALTTTATGRPQMDGAQLTGTPESQGIPKIGSYSKSKGEKRMGDVDLSPEQPTADGGGFEPDYSAQMAELGLTRESVREHLARSRAATADLRGPDTTPRPQI
ncbi:MAG: hypothetical protein KI792_03350 [Alphaproteobacteria bacterium]|nr:hypothetical protein [Alphaproteobacteria bacterium SS10]